MEDPWHILEEAGLPDGAGRRRRGGPIDVDRLRMAVEEFLSRAEPIESRCREPLFAWLQAGFHHWPRRFEEILGTATGPCKEFLAGSADKIDPNRYLKLRRIAIENLSGWI